MTVAAKIPHQIYVNLFNEGVSLEEIALHLGRNLETVKRALRRAGALAHPTRHYVPDLEAKVARAQLLRAEGVPINWIAEDLGVSRHFVINHTVTNAEANREWKKCWSFLMHDPDLLKLHYSIAPKGAKS